MWSIESFSPKKQHSSSVLNVNDSKPCREPAENVWADSERPGNFACKYAAPYLGCAKFVTLENDSQASRESPETFWAFSETPGNFTYSGPVPAHALPLI